MSYGRDRGNSEPQYDNDMRVALWHNDDKRGDNDPDYKGSGMYDGKEFWAAAWYQDGGNSKAPAMIIRTTPKDDAGQQRGGSQRGGGYQQRGGQQRGGRPSGRGHRSEGLEY